MGSGQRSIGSRTLKSEAVTCYNVKHTTKSNEKNVSKSEVIPDSYMLTGTDCLARGSITSISMCKCFS